ncbi:MAG: hypothetical protein QNJ94_03570 [Alphaproteobacteria bacterium]|nr:hypothetical protein [Alphaproteobacteria bacterium]
MIYDHYGLVSRWEAPAKRCGALTILGALGVLSLVAFAAVMAMS